MTTDTFTPEEMAAGNDSGWEAVPADPDPERDLGYRMLDLEVVPVPANDQTMFLPSDEDMLRDDSFVVVADDLLIDVLENR